MRIYRCNKGKDINAVHETTENAFTVRSLSQLLIL